MKSIKKISALTLILAGILLKTSIVFSQTCNNTVGSLAGPNRVEVQAPPGTTNSFICLTTGTSVCSPTSVPGTLTMPGFGVNQNNPAYMVDILCNPGATPPTNMDVNISSTAATGIPANAAGYRIGGNQVLYTGGDPTSIFVGGQIPVLGAYTLTNGSNVCIGYNTYASFTGGYSNTFAGAWAGNQMVYGHKNTYVGDSAGFSDKYGIYNTFIGYECGAFTRGISSYTPPNPYGDYNTMCGYKCGYENVTGHANNYYGKEAGYWNNGNENSMCGAHSGNGISGSDVDSNAFLGNYSGYRLSSGNNNVLIGHSAGYSSGTATGTSSGYNVFVGGLSGSKHLKGNYNVTIGYGADAYGGSPSTPGPINNAVAIGAESYVKNDNQVILGNNSQFCGIGMSTDAAGPLANLEIQTDLDQNVPTSFPFIGNGDQHAGNYYGGSGFSGLKFRDLTSNSTPVDPSNSNFDPVANPYPTGVLSLDGSGNVIYVNQSSVAGDCTTPTVIPATDGAFDLATNLSNFYFQGNSSGAFNAEDVLIGYSCGFGPIPAKLNVLQNSLVSPSITLPQPSIGLYVENDDLRFYPTISTGAYIPTIGIKGYMPPSPPGSPVGCKYLDIAGWFEADDPSSCSSMVQYALYVPQRGGLVSIGFPYWNLFSHYSTMPSLLWVNQGIMTNAHYTPSDSNIKKNVAPFTYGIKAIRNLNPVSYNYNGIGAFDTTGRYIGLIAQNFMRNVPGGVVATTIAKDSLPGDTETIENIYNEAVMYTAINAIKQVDSASTSNQTKQQQINDSLRSTLDSLRTAFKNIQTCLTTLCSNSRSPFHTNEGTGNSGDSTTAITNVQSILLSAASNAPLLYQNIPNPFSSGTKINYYLPEGTIGATLVFYDTYGNQMKTVPLSQTGNGTLNITPDNLTAGIYSYSLIVNNTMIDTKRMILQK